MGKESQPYQMHVERISFIEKAVGEGALEEIPASERNQTIAFVCYLNEGISQKELGGIFLKPSGEPLTRQYVSQMSKSVLKELWKRVSPQLRAEYPLRELLMRRPTALREVTSRVKIAVEKGAVTPMEIKETGVSNSQLGGRRRTLGKRNIRVPHWYNLYSDFAETVMNEDNDQELQGILDRSNNSSLMGYLQRYKEDPERILITLASILKEAKFYPYTRKNLEFFAEKLKKNGIPIKTIVRIHRRISRNGENYQQVYYIVFCKHEQRITRALRDDPDLQKFKKIPVEVSENIPAYL